MSDEKSLTMNDARLASVKRPKTPHSPSVTEFASSVTTHLKEGRVDLAAEEIGTVLGGIIDKIPTMSDAAKSVLKAGKDTFAHIAETSKDAIEGLTKLVDMCVRTVDPLVKAIKSVAQGFADFVKNPHKDLSNIAKHMKESLNTLYDMSIGRAISGAFQSR